MKSAKLSRHSRTDFRIVKSKVDFFQSLFWCLTRGFLCVCMKVAKRLDLVYGGGGIGLMGLVARAVHGGGGRVLGCIYMFLFGFLFFVVFNLG